jgi:pimeloyl-ACP methyl ester carboxylesterase
MKIKLRDIDVTYEEAGSGPPVILIHGLAEDRRSWSEVQKALPSYTTFAYDIRGHGGTTVGDGDGTLAQLSGDLLAFIEKLTGPAICVGYSLGGTIVLWAAAHKPHLIKHAVLVGTSSVVGRRAGEFFDQRIKTLSQNAAEFARDLRSDTAAQLVTAPEHTDLVTAKRLAAVGNGSGYINAARAMRRLVDEPLTAILHKISCPVDVISGEKDSFCPPKAAEMLLSTLPNARYQEIAGAGHLMSVDNPAAYSAAIKQALNRSVAI